MLCSAGFQLPLLILLSLSWVSGRIQVPCAEPYHTIFFPMAQPSLTFPVQSPRWSIMFLIKLSSPHEITHNYFMKLLFSAISKLQEIRVVFISFSLLQSFFSIWPKNLLLDILSSYFEKHAICFCSTFMNSSLFLSVALLLLPCIS